MPLANPAQPDEVNILPRVYEANPVLPLAYADAYKYLEADPDVAPHVYPAIGSVSVAYPRKYPGREMLPLDDAPYMYNHL